LCTNVQGKKGLQPFFPSFADVDLTQDYEKMLLLIFSFIN